MFLINERSVNRFFSLFVPVFEFFHSSSYFQLAVFFLQRLLDLKHKDINRRIKILVRFDCRFFYVFAVRSSVLVRLKTTLLSIASLAVLGVLTEKVSLGESNVWCRNNDISSSISVTYSIFPGIGGIALKKNCVRKDVFEPALVLSILEADVLFACTKSFWNIIIGLYSISFIVC